MANFHLSFVAGIILLFPSAAHAQTQQPQSTQQADTIQQPKPKSGTVIKLYCGPNRLLPHQQPLYVVNGKPLKGEKSLQSINPNDIEKIDILKDKKAVERFGPAAINGAVLITTKTGKR
ncbi:TonB-dependent receptor plug domain-containing protein [Hymenobacter psychrotolerans]|uniref:TonB-dependent Receptor Plug Domain n=1 Tax=Hymenobacter psychrotolerans DSM 18569 TaxID=1121959 RepID=A0A1M6VD52_9BACT|nr:TonB-dependent receptor plug domain-containing protein [Hymenobacter psychrotolerans]SHK79379.1 TonB-dependent Receptor Plug Domain [Hymenobacter psychrotolerans DSM 18569]